MTAEILFTLDLVIDELIKDDCEERNWFSTATPGMERHRSSGHLVLLSLIVLSETLVSSWKIIYAKNENIHLRPSYGFLFPNVIKELLRNAGWCPGEISAMDTDSDINCSSAFLLSSMDRNILCKNHLSCDEVRCKAYDIDYDIYESKHVTQGCRCELLPRTNEPADICISWILDDGGMPIVWLSDQGKDQEAVVNVIYCPVVRR